MEEEIKETVEKYLEKTIPKYLEKIIQVVEERLNLQAYSIRAATKVTGIGYSKLYNAAMQGKIPSIYDGRTYKVKHTDLFFYMENEKAKNRL
jgi:excisionase family DNA binding protein